uniref:Uncharacterized protein n=1 Tax=viral metagenome TaxID=1070528 RepID=A0A6M3LB62_9ZZZZ
MTERMWCIVDADGKPLLWTIRSTRRAVISSEMPSAPCDMDWRTWKRQQGYRTARCTVTVEE